MEKKKTGRLALVGIGLIAIICLVVLGALASVFAFSRLTSARDLQLTFRTENQQRDGKLQHGEEKGVVIIHVDADSPAAAAGLRRGNIILQLNSREVNTLGELRQEVLQHKAGDTISLTVLDGDEEREIQVTLADTEPYLGVNVVGDREIPSLAESEDTSPFFDEFGHMMPFLEDPRFRALPPGEMPRFNPRDRGFPGLPEVLPILPDGVETAVIVLSVVPDSPAEAAGLRAGDAIVEVNGEQIDSQDSFAELIRQISPGEKVELMIVRGSESLNFTVTVGEKPNDPNSGYIGIFMGPEIFQGPFFSEENNDG